MIVRNLIVCTAVMLCTSFAIAQAVTPAATSPAPAVAPAAPAAPAAVATADGKYMLHDGDDVSLKFSQAVSSKTAQDGDPVNLVLDEDLKVGSIVVARAGAKAVGEVTNARKAGMMGKAGELNMRIDYLRVGDTKIRLRGVKGKEGQSGQTSAIVLTVLLARSA